MYGTIEGVRRPLTSRERATLAERDRAARWAAKREAAHREALADGTWFQTSHDNLYGTW